MTVNRKSLATHALQIYWQLISSTFRYPVAFFLTKTATAEDMKVWIKEGITMLTDVGLCVKYLLSDGGSSNRSLYEVRPAQKRWDGALAVRAPGGPRPPRERIIIGLTFSEQLTQH